MERARMISQSSTLNGRHPCIGFCVELLRVDGWLIKTLVAVFILVSAIPGRASDGAPTVSVTGGQIRGTMLEKGGAVFKGIPYAQPPLADLRWREPMEVKSWTGARDATAFGPMCAQATAGGGATGEEDCLFLNVWTPEWPGRSRKPVMVSFPGGGNFSGGSSDAVFDGESLARRGVVLVTINYRLGSFGFFAHPELTRESRHRASGNQGVLDQIAALKWVRANVSRLGGDPNNVTIFGNSAGSIDAIVLMTSPLSKGLFQRVIGQSGTVLPAKPAGDLLTLAEAEQRGETFASRWKVHSGASVKDLRLVSAADILKAEPNYFMGARFPYLGIAIDGYVVKMKPAEVFARGEQQRVPLLLGNTARDRVPGTTSPKDLKKAIEEEYGGPIAARAEMLYEGGTDVVYGSPADQWNTDTSFRCATVAQLSWHVAAGNPAFEFEFARVPSGREALGATHGSDISYLFGTMDGGIRVFFGPPAHPTAVDAQISEVIQQYFTNFAKTGNPNGSKLPVWKPFDVSSRAYMQFTDTGPIAKEGLRRPYCDLYIENVKRQRDVLHPTVSEKGNQ